MSMPQTLDRSAVEALVRAALKQQADPRAFGAADTTSHSGPAGRPGPIAAGEVLLKPSALRSPTDPAALRALLSSTPARIAVGRTGSRYTTATLLRFRADPAAAKEAVMSEVDSALLARLGFVEVYSQAVDKRHFLQRPDAGRALCEAARQAIAARLSRGQELQIIYGDGLSAVALNHNLEGLHGALRTELQKRGPLPPARLPWSPASMRPWL